MKKFLHLLTIAGCAGLSLMLLVGTAAALEQSASPYGYANVGYAGQQQYGGCNPSYQPNQMGQVNGGVSGCGMNDWSRNPGATEYCTKWIAGHWVSVKVMVPGRWEYRPVWIPGYPTTQYQWVRGFWQTTGYHTQPDVYVWGSQNAGWYGMPTPYYQPASGGYFTPQGVWVGSTQSGY